MSNLDQIPYKGMEGSSDIEKCQVDESDPVHLECIGISKKECRGMIDEELWKRTFSTELLMARSPLTFSCSIFKVPEVLRRQKTEAYAPDIVSIGPLHRGAKKLQLLENVKKWYLRCFLARQQPNSTGLSLLELIERMSLDSLTKSLESLTERIKAEELDTLARVCYSDPCDHLDQTHFIEMLILDGCFLIELFRKAQSEDRQDNDDPIFNLSCMLEYLYHDLLLLENQLPWFVVEFFYNEIERRNPKPLLSEVVIDFFKDSVADTKIFSSSKPDPEFEILHILDLVRTSLVQDHEVLVKVEYSPSENKDSGANHLPQRIPSVTALSDVGVKFKNGPSGCILNIKFEKGVFTIPPLAIDERTGPLFRNLMAYEQCYHNCEHKIISYAFLMNHLIDTKNDVDLLCEEEIVANFDNIDASKFFKDLSHLTNDTGIIDFIYKELYAKVHNYREAPLNKIPWNKWRKKLRRDYFETPWSTISFFAAFVLLVLTFLQTVYTAQQYYHSPN